MLHQRNVLLYIIGQDITTDIYDYLHRLLPAVTHGAYKVVLLNQTDTFTPELAYIAAQHNTVEIISLAIPASATWLLRIRTLMAYFHELKPTIIHLLTNSIPCNHDCQIAMWLAQVPHRVVSIALINPDDSPPRVWSSITKLFTRYVLQTMHCIIVPTPTTKQHMQSHYRLTTTPIEVIPIGIDTTHYSLHQINHPTRADYHLPAQGSIIAAIGTFTQAKGHTLLIQAMRTVWQQYPDTQLVLVGSGPELGNLQALAHKSNQPDYIHFLSPLDDERYFLTLVDLYVHPSLQEGMSFHLLNAMALERPVIASAIFNVQAVIEANASGLLVRPNDPDALASAIIRLLNNHELRITIGINARTRISQRFQLAQWHQRTIACYHSLTESV